MGNVGFHALRDLALALRDAGNLSAFIETGTYKGETARWAAGQFEQVHTIEAYEPYYRKAQNESANIRYHHGDSRRLLPEVLAELPGPALVWLDAHWIGNMQDSTRIPGGECPLREELQALNGCPANHVVMIDDARLFTGRPPSPHDPAQWPHYSEVRRLLTARHPRYVTVWNDAIIAVPPELAHIVRRYARAANDLQVTVLTSNAYLRCLAPFAYLFNKYFDHKQPVTIVRHEVRPRGLPPNFSNFAVGDQAEYTWSQGLIKYLNYLPDDHLLLLLEDYFITQPVNVKRLHELQQLMRARPEIAKIDLSGDLIKRAHLDYGHGLAQAADEALFQTSIQAALWRRDFLRRFLEPSESPWQFEKKGGKRVVQARQAGEFNALVLGVKQPAIHYVNAVGGEGNRPGQYDFRKFLPGLKSELEGKGLL